MDKDYSKREMDVHIKTLTDKIAEATKDLAGKMDDNTALTRAIDTKVAIQNGRVAKLEGKAKWLSGVGAVISIALMIIISLVVYSFQLSQENLKQSIMLEINEHLK